MKKTIFTILLSLLAINVEARPYLGLQWNTLKTDYDDAYVNSKEYYETDFRAFSPVIGYNLTNSDSIEVSYFYDSQRKSNNNTGLVWISGPLAGEVVETQVKTSLHMLNFDLVHSEKITNTNIKILGNLGASLIDFEVKEGYNDGSIIKENSKGYAANLGLGAEIDLHENFALNTKVKYNKVFGVEFVNVNGINELDNIITFSVGTKITF
jgi:opacity protein-like surface antigen